MPNANKNFRRRAHAQKGKTPPNRRLRNKVHKPSGSARKTPVMSERTLRMRANDLWGQFKKTFLSTAEKRGKSIIALVLACVFVSSIVLGQNQPRPEPVKQAARVPLSLSLSCKTLSAEDGTYLLNGFGGYSASEIKGSLSLDPQVNFELQDDPQGIKLLMKENYRNIMYTATFKTPAYKGGAAKEYSFEINAPELGVKFDSPGTMFREYEQIELVFTEQADLYSLKENMKLEPAAAFTLSYEDGPLNRVWVIPDEGWLYSDKYEIKIDEGYKSANGKSFNNAQTLNFSIIDSDYKRRIYPYVDFHNGSFLMNDGSDITMTFTAEHLVENIPVYVDTYRMSSLDKFREQGHIYLDYAAKLDGLEKMDSNVFLIRNGENKFSAPNFGEGAYIVAASYADPTTKTEKQVRSAYLVTPISVYMQTSERETTIWLNSSKRDAPLSGYEVTFTGADAPAGVTDASGLLIVPNEELPANEDEWMTKLSFSITDPEGKLAYYDNAEMYVSQEHQERYYSYLFLDRTLYKPEDTVCFWGFVKPFRYNTRPLPETATVRFDPDGLNIEVEASIGTDGTFSGEIPLERIKSTQYAVQAELFYPAEKPDEKDSTHVIKTEYVSVKEFQKPTYVLSSKTDKDYYGNDEQVNVTVSAAFYDGTPLTDFPLEIGYYNTRLNEWTDLPNAKTDSTGQVTFSFPSSGGGEDLTYTGLLSNKYKVQIASDGEQVTHLKSYDYFTSDILLETGYELQANGNLSLTARAYKLDVKAPSLKTFMDEIKVGGEYWRLYDIKELLNVAKGEPVDTTLNLDLRWSYTDEKRILHRTIDEYASEDYIRYENSYSLDQIDPGAGFEVIDDWETKVKRISVDTKDGVAVINDIIYKRADGLIDFDEPVYSMAEITYTDSKDNKGRTYEYYSNRSDYDYWNRGRGRNDDERVVKGYSFAITDNTTGEDLTPPYYYYQDITLPAGHSARFSLLLDGEPVETNGRMLYTIIQDGLYEHRTVNSNSLELTYKTEYGKNIRMVAAYFDGEKTHYVKQFDISPGDESFKVDIEVTPDKKGYRPGETVNLNIRATDYMGRGVAGEMCVAVVDEAIFALAEQEIDVLYSLYQDMYSINNSVWQYCTTYRYENVPGEMWDGGKGDDGGAEFYDSYRSKFKDTALFLPTQTDVNGNSRISFVLPDNTTSWRITAVEVGRDLRAGNSKSNIISSLPFFVKPVLTSKYIEGDDVAMLVQGFGSLLDNESDIAYTVTLTGDGVNAVQSGEAKSGKPLELNFGKLPVGSYKIVSKAQYSGYSDAVELPLYVLKSNLELVINKKLDLKEKLDIEAMRYPVTLTLYDKENEAFLASINSLFGHYCMQANQRLSRFVAKRVVRQTVVDGEVPYYIAEGNDNASDMQNPDGGIAFYPGRASEPLVTTYVLLVAKDQFDLPMMSKYYRNELAKLGTPKMRAACYLGLAAIGDVTAGELLAELEKPDIPADAQAYLIAGLAYLGETEKASQLYEQKLSSKVAGVNPEIRQNEAYELNAAAIWVAASSLHHPDADALSLYFGNTHWRYRTLFECMIYVTNYNKQVQPVSFSYNVKGETKQVNMGLAGIHTMSLSKSELESLSFNSVPDSIFANAYYVGEPSEFGLKQSDNMSIAKTIRPLDSGTYEVSLIIKLKKDAPTGDYDISDWVPSNTRLYSYDQDDGAKKDPLYFNTESEGQKLYVSFRINKAEERTIIYRYRVRQTFQSEAALDTTYMIQGDTGDNCSTQKAMFTPAAGR